MNLKISRAELEFIHDALKTMVEGWEPHVIGPLSHFTVDRARKLAQRIHSYKGDYDTEQKLVE